MTSTMICLALFVLCPGQTGSFSPFQSATNFSMRSCFFPEFPPCCHRNNPMGCVCNGQGNMIAVQSLAFKAQRGPLHPRAMVTLDEVSLQALLLYLEKSQQLSRYSNVALHLGNESSETSPVSSPWAFRPSRFERSFTFFQPLLSVLLGTVPWVGSSSGR